MKRGGDPMLLSEHVALARQVGGAVNSSEPGTGIVPRRCRRCGGALPRTSAGLCTECDAEELAQRRAADVCDRSMIPPRFRWARLDLPIFAPPGHRRPIVSDRALATVRGFRGSLLVIRSELSGAGKTSLGIARLLQEAERGASAVCVRCADLSPEAPDQELASTLFYRARRERVVLIDGIGNELAGAPAGDGLAARRKERVYRLLLDLHDMSGAGARPRMLIITTGLSDAAISRAYGADIWRRIFDPSAEGDDWHVLTLGAPR